MSPLRKEVLYVAFDVEAAGDKLEVHSTLSVGACAVSRSKLACKEYFEKGLVFYAELKPASLRYVEAAMRVGCLHLECLEKLRVHDPQFDPKHAQFDPLAVLGHMQTACESPDAAAERFETWLKKVAGNKVVIPVTDTVFFDSPHVSAWIGASGVPGSLLGYSGRDLKSMYQGYTGRKNARLKELRVDKNEQPHKADADAVELAQKTNLLVYEKLGW